MLNCTDEEHLAASVDPAEYPVAITADAAQLQSVVTSFQRTLNEVSLVAYPRNGPQRHGPNAQKQIQIVSYVSPAKGAWPVTAGPSAQ